MVTFILVKGFFKAVFFMFSVFLSVQSLNVTSIYTFIETCKSAEENVYGGCHDLQIHIQDK